jgi:hypothetical protein
MWTKPKGPSKQSRQQHQRNQLGVFFLENVTLILTGKDSFPSTNVVLLFFVLWHSILKSNSDSSSTSSKEEEGRLRFQSRARSSEIESSSAKAGESSESEYEPD